MSDEYEDDYTGSDSVSVLFHLNANAMEDIPVICEWHGAEWDQIASIFELVTPDYYNYNNIPLEFFISSGDVKTDIPIVFSVMRAVQDYASYILQKTYCVTSELNNLIDLEIYDWNVSPNKTWYLYVNGLSVILYETQADLLAGTNPIALGTADSTTLEVVLTTLDEYDEYDELLGFYYQDMAIHLRLSVSLAIAHYFKIKPFTDLYEIRHPIYNNTSIVLSRGEAELNLHTYSITGKELVLGTHIPTIEAGDVVNYTSTRRNTSIKSQVLSQTISGEVSDNGECSLVNTLQVANYTELYRR